MNKSLKVILISGSIPVVLILLLLVRYYIGNGKVVEANTNLSRETLQLPQVETLSIIPLIDSKTTNNIYKTEDGVSYLIKTDQDTILFDVGYNKRDEKISPLLYNLAKMNLSLDEIDAIAISHAHVDHCGGIAVMKEKKVKLTKNFLDLKGKKLFLPVPLKCDTTTNTIITNPQMLGKTIASTGPLAVQMFATGRLVEQSLLVNLKDKGLVVIVGCGHPQIETIIKIAEALTGTPVYAVVGGAHLYYTEVQDKFWRNLFGSSKPFCRSLTKQEVLSTANFVQKSGVCKVYLSPHDSDEATQKIFAKAYGENYETIQVGRQISF